jgi:hypothetical protein
MLTLLNQTALSILQAVFGIVALWVVSRLGSGHDHARAWHIAGLIFLVNGVQALMQDVFAASAFLSGPGSPLWDRYLAWAPSLNHGRTVAFTFSFPLLLLVGWSVLRRPQALRAAVVGTLLLGMGVGALLGRAEGVFTLSTHFSAVAVLDAAELVILLSVLFVVLLRNLADRFLWGALFVYAFSLAVGAVWMAALALINIPGGWAPSPLQMHAARWTLAAVGLWFALRRLSMARNKLPATGLLESVSRATQPVQTL